MIILAILGFIGIKIYSQAQASPTQAAVDASANQQAQAASGGVAPPSPSTQPVPLADPGSAAAGGLSPLAPPTTSNDPDDDGAMAQTAAAVQSSFEGDPSSGSLAPGLGDFDQNVTQDDSGSETAASGMWRQAAKTIDMRPGGINKVLHRIWNEAMDVDYMSSQPGIAFAFQPPGMTRQDWNPNLNRQPWTRDTSFMENDPSGDSPFDDPDDSNPSFSNDLEEDS